MGIIDALTGVATAASEAAHGTRLRRELEAAMAAMQRMSKAQCADVTAAFGKITRDLWMRRREWTRDGRLKAAATMRSEGLKTRDFNLVQGYTFLMASAWLESQERSSAEARAVFAYLDDLGHKAGLESFRNNNPLFDLAMTAFTFIIGIRIRRIDGIDLATERVERFIRDADLDVIDTLSAIGCGIARALEVASKEPLLDCLVASMAFLYMSGAPRDRIEALYDAIEDRESQTALFSALTMARVYRIVPQADRLMQQAIADGGQFPAMVALLPLVDLID